MTLSVKETLALATVMLWPVIPLFWVPVHSMPAFFRRLGLFTYVVPAALWLPVAAALFHYRDTVLQHRIELPVLVSLPGLALFLAGLALQLWTLRLLSGPVITGMPEVTDRPAQVVRTGPFGVIRHPTYLSHTMLFAGVFLWTGIAAAGIVTLLDALLVNAVIIPLEERELRARFGRDYEAYLHDVPCRILPFCRRQP